MLHYSPANKCSLFFLHVTRCYVTASLRDHCVSWEISECKLSVNFSFICQVV
uniref:Uncharacterized protein n=1 Tax=Anguilla anguilla TaxID=7936 RepID=A0A0E9WKS0_ANGAN